MQLLSCQDTDYVQKPRSEHRAACPELPNQAALRHSPALLPQSGLLVPAGRALPQHPAVPSQPFASVSHRQHTWSKLFPPIPTPRIKFRDPFPNHYEVKSYFNRFRFFLTNRGNTCVLSLQPCILWQQHGQAWRALAGTGAQLLQSRFVLGNRTVRDARVLLLSWF